MTVKANCSDCGSVHTVAVRIQAQGTTKCPSCDSKRYTSEYDGTTVNTDQLRDQLLDVKNVGPGIVNNIESQFGSLSLLRTATVTEIATVDEVGPTTAERIKQAV